MLRILEEKIYIDLNPRVISIKEVPSGIVIELICDDWGDSSQRSFMILAKGVVKNSLGLGSIEFVSWTHEHPILANYVSPQAELYFSSQPTDILSVVEIMNEAHRKFYGSWKQYGFPSIALLRGGYGLLESGPKELMSLYKENLKGLLELSLVDAYSPKLDVGILFLGEGYVICNSAEAIEL
ncbi:hypothetical protein [Thaumasiovibrio subtropicus]|uniref:hypothetical protein n=1 Tax=Thaumasiovibrio subtropicus TaxID=1891207 RepID=UPI00131C2FCB|nr:hypothetical protein [Thaumasiovibrio subtropicus]